jgi:hypothetical protein
VRVLGVAIVSAVVVLGPSPGSAADPGLRFAWPEHGDAQVELTDERSVGDESRSVVLSMRLHVAPDASTDRLVVRLSGVRVVSVDGAPAAAADPARIALAVARVLKRVTPVIVVGRDGRFVESRELDRVAEEVLTAAGFPELPPELHALAESVSELVNTVAVEDWSEWVGSWVGENVAPGEWTQADRDMELDGSRVTVHTMRRGLEPGELPGRTRLQASAVYPSSCVRNYTSGFLIDLAREAKELGDDDPVASERFLERARYSPVRETLTVELESATMRPITSERVRTFSASHGRHTVEGRERRVHRFAWAASPGR